MRTYADYMRKQGQKAAEEQAKEDAQKAKSQQGQQTHKDPMRAARWAALLGSGVADAESTRQALKRPGNYEANPVTAKIVGNTPLSYAVKLGVNSGMAAILDKTHKTNPKLANVLALLMSGLQAGVAIRNTKVGKK